MLSDSKLEPILTSPADVGVLRQVSHALMNTPNSALATVSMEVAAP